jgi:DNA-binding XRE family transcriptional regulator
MRPRPPVNRNRLWIARKRLGLGQKNVARLLGHGTTSVISEYETGRVLPGLRTAIKLSVIYGMPVPELFGPLLHEVCDEVEAVRKQSPWMKAALSDSDSTTWNQNHISNDAFSP